MMKKDEGSDKKPASPRGRIMQVVEVEEEDTLKQKVDVPVPSDIVKGEESTVDKVGDKEEKPDIASSFPMPEHTEEKSQTPQEKTASVQDEIPVLKNGEKRDIVSELFETKNADAHYPNISLDKKPSRFRFLIWVIVLLGIVGLIGAGLLYMKQKSTSGEPIQSSVPTPTPTLIPTETETPSATPSGKMTTITPTKFSSPSATPKKTGLSIQILNGSGKSGVASTMKKYLEDKGYNVLGTGNAVNFDYEKTDIIIKADKTSFLDKLKTDLSASYSVGSTSATLDPQKTYDAQVIIGKE